MKYLKEIEIDRVKNIEIHFCINIKTVLSQIYTYSLCYCEMYSNTFSPKTGKGILQSDLKTFIEYKN